MANEEKAAATDLEVTDQQVWTAIESKLLGKTTTILNQLLSTAETTTTLFESRFTTLSQTLESLKQKVEELASHKLQQSVPGSSMAMEILSKGGLISENKLVDANPFNKFEHGFDDADIEDAEEAQHDAVKLEEESAGEETAEHEEADDEYEDELAADDEHEEAQEVAVEDAEEPQHPVDAGVNKKALKKRNKRARQKAANQALWHQNQVAAAAAQQQQNAEATAAKARHEALKKSAHEKVKSSSLSREAGRKYRPKEQFTHMDPYYY